MRASVAIVASLFFVACLDSASVKKAKVTEGTFRGKEIGTEIPNESGFQIRPLHGWRAPVDIDYSRYEKGSPLEITLQRAHTEHIKDVLFSPDGRLIVTAEKGRAIKIWNTEGELLRTIAPPLSERDAMRSWVTFTPDGRSIAVGGVQKSIWIFDLNGELSRKLSGKLYNFELIAMSRDRSLIATDVYQDKMGTTSGLVIRDANWRVRRIIETGATIRAIAVSPDGKYIATTPGYGNYKTSHGWRSSVRVWSPGGTLIGELEVNKPPSAVTGKKETIIGDVAWITFSPDGRFLAVMGTNHHINIRTPEGDLVSHIRLDKTRYWPKKCFFTPDRKSVIAANRDFVEKFGIQGQREGWFAIHPELRSAGIDNIDISPDGRFIAIGFWAHNRYGGTREKGSVKIWDWRGRPVAYVREDALEVKGVEFSPDNRRCILELDRYRESIIWDLALNRLDRINESIRFDGKGGEYRFSYYGPHKRNRTFYNKLRIRYNGNESSFNYRTGDWYVFASEGAIAKQSGSSIDFFDINGKPLRRVNALRGSTDVGNDRIVFSADGKHFIWGAFTSSIFLYDLSTKKPEEFKTGYRVTAAAIDRGERYIASGHKNGYIFLWTRSGKRVQELRGHHGKINDLTFSFDGKYLVSTSTDRTVRVWNVATGSSITLVVYETGDWVVFDKQGRFDCSDDARRYVRFIKGMTSYSFQQFWNDFFTPGLFARVVTGKRLRVVDIAKKVQDAPVVSIQYPMPFANREQIAVTVCARAQGNGIGRIFLFHNGRALDEKSRGLEVVSRDNCKTFTVTLTPGENAITGAAYDRDNRVYGRSDRIVLSYSPERVVKPDMYVLAVGVSDYRDRNIRLGSPADDAKAISRVLKEVGSTLYGTVHTIVLTDRNATREQIRGKMSEILRSVGRVDTVILFFAGHGDTEKGVYYYLPYDADITNLKATCISIVDLSSFARMLPANKMAIFLDTCKSGSATEDLSTVALKRGYGDRRIIANLAKERGIVVFSSSSPAQDAYEIKAIGHGIFTYCMLDALRNRRDDIVNGKLISIARLLSLVNRTTRDTAYQYLKMEQSPILYMFGDDFGIGLIR